MCLVLSIPAEWTEYLRLLFWHQGGSRILPVCKREGKAATVPGKGTLGLLVYSSSNKQQARQTPC